MELTFPAWRPGRYELGNFAKNIQVFQILDEGGKPLVFQKTSKNRWLVETGAAKTMVVRYNYFAFELNAGSTFLDESQLYVNPVNCFVYCEALMNAPCELTVQVPDDYQFASSLKFDGQTAQVSTYHELVDSPFIASNSLQHFTFDCEGIAFHVWFQGPCKIDWERVQKDFIGYTRKQVEAFGSFPVDEYHYLYQISATRAYHGVEHLASTVIHLGPGHDLMAGRYEDFLGVSSHELYHAWNIKTIRPVEMHPYDYSGENYTKLGYVAEGVTTYLGDVFLLKGKAFTVEQYMKALGDYIQRHFDNEGRFNMSVADSSFDTWLDGYVPGVPGRKVSIYTEGCLLALILDTQIMQATQNQQSLHDVMRVLYEDAQQGKPYTEERYKSVAEEVSGLDLSEYFKEYVNGTRTLEGLLIQALEYLGFQLEKKDNPKMSERVFGMKLSGSEIARIASGSPAEMCGLSMKDEILAVNGWAVDKSVDSWLEFFDAEDKVLTVKRSGRLIEKRLPIVDSTFMRKYVLTRSEQPTKPQREAFNRWSSKKK